MFAYLKQYPITVYNIHSETLVLAEHNTFVTYECHKHVSTQDKYITLILTQILRDT